MFKRLTTCMLLMMACVFAINAQQQLPLNPKVRHGVLPNGLTYYVMHNEEPKGRANFYIAQKVGSALETPQQLGLAHFLEHMAFNGSKNFPGNQMLNYLQNKGVRFGSDINAYTGFDETVYRIENIPCSDVALMDSTLLILHDWSCDLLLDDAEIDSERGVIEEEWRSRNNADTRMYADVLPKLYKEYQYSQMPIGSMDIVRNFPYKDLRDYYEKWYRPDQQGIVVVGDFDVDEMEAKVKELFTPITMPENAAPREYVAISGNDEPIYVAFEDPELQRTMAMFCIKFDKTPFEYRNTDASYANELAKNLIATMINNRLSELAQKPSCSFAYAGVDFDNYFVSASKEAFTVVALAKSDVRTAFREALEEVVRSCKTGFTDSELARAKEELKAGYEKLYNERDKTKTSALANQFIRNFIDNSPAMDIETEWDVVQQIFGMINVQQLNQVVSNIITPANQVLLVSQPKAEGRVLPTEDEMLNIIKEVEGAQYEAYVDEVITDPLIAKLPKKGKIKSTKEISQFGVKEFTLSNGAHVYIKPTDFAADDIRFIAYAPTGKNVYHGAKEAELNALAVAVEASKLADFDNIKLSKVLTGKNLGTTYFMNIYSNGFTGFSNNKDLETLMQLLYLQFTDLQPDTETYEASKSNIIPRLTYREKDPSSIYMRHVRDAWYNHAPYSQGLTAEQLSEADYNTMVEIARAQVANAANFDFIFVGNIDENTFIPLMEQYIASLPGNVKKANAAKKNPETYMLRQATGQVTDFFDLPMENPQVKVFNAINGTNVPFSLENSIMTDLAGDILTIIFTRTLREEEGGTYSPSANAVLDPKTGEWTLVYAFDTGADKKDKLTARAYDEMIKLFNEGATEEDFNKVKGAALAQFNINSKKNSFWANTIHTLLQDGYDSATEYENILNGLTLEQLNTFMKNLYDGKNRIQVILNGVAVEKK